MAGIGALHGIEAAADKDSRADATQRRLVPSIEGVLIADEGDHVVVRTAAGVEESVQFPAASAAAAFVRDGARGRANFHPGDDVVAEVGTDHRPFTGSALLTSYGYIEGQVEERSTGSISTTGGQMLVSDDTVVARMTAPPVRVPSWSIKLGERVRASVISTPSGKMLARQITIDDRH